MKIKIEGFIMKTRFGTEPIFCGADMSEYGYLMICPISVDAEYEMPEGWSAQAAEISAIDKKLDVMADEYHIKTKQLMNRKAELQCIDNLPMTL